jgi:hypothetical protein
MVEREAIQWDGTAGGFVELEDFGAKTFIDVHGDLHLWVAANGAWLKLEVSEWVIKDSHGYYPCKDDAFQEKYEVLG